MHKSGTTLVSQILNSSGIDMGEFDPDVHYDRGNKYERAESLALDMDILGMDSYDVLNLPHSAPSSLTQDQREGIQSIVSACEAKHSDWGMKDPRMCMTYHLWAKALPPHRLIVVYRDPAHIWPRYRWRGLRGIVNNPGRAHTYQRLWIEHNRGILAALESGAAENIVLHYHELMTEDREFQRLQTFVGHDLNDLRKPEMYRSRSEPDLLMKTTGWWLKKQTGLTTDGIFSKLVEYRSRQIEAEAGP
jgi:hypothetical protein